MPPIITCRDNAPCTKDCYAVKAAHRYPNARKAWQNNLEVYQASPEQFFTEVSDFLLKKKPERFRWHVAGDIPDTHYAQGMLEVARNHSNVKFLCFTKNYRMLSLIQPAIPENLAMIASVWPGLAVPAAMMNVPKAYLTCDRRLPKEYYKCVGSCVDCAVCWELAQLGCNVAFDKH